MSEAVRVIELAEPAGGWFVPWPNVFELSRALPSNRWTLVGGLMVQAHALAHGVNAVRPTEDLDLLLNIEMLSAVVIDADRVISALGYTLQEPADARRKRSPHYRYVRDGQFGVEKIDVMIPDHAGPKATRRLRGHPMFEVEGGTQALGRTLVFEMLTRAEGLVRITVPDELGALVLKGAAYRADSRDRDRHLQDAAVLAACITDHATELSRLGGSDRKRIRILARALSDSSSLPWLVLSPDQRVAGQDTLRILSR